MFSNKMIDDNLVRLVRLIVLLAVSSFVGCVSTIQGKILEEETVPVSNQQAVQSGVGKLPCDIVPPITGDKVYLVIWYKEGVVKPIYTFDARFNSLDQAKHWADELLGGRASFHYGDEPAKLKIENVRDQDGGVYKCRVDFQRSPTRNSVVNLTVILPPENLSILDNQGAHIPHYILGPYNEGGTIEITCVAIGGRPTPRVTWWQENALLDETYEVLPERRVRNVLTLEKLERKHLHTVFTCQASNNNLIAPISSAVTLDMNLRPLVVRLKGENKPLSANNPYELACEVWGSRPAPTISWWKASAPMRNTREIADPDGNKTTSILTFIPTIEDSGKYLSCRGVQSLIPDSGLEDGWKLDIYHVPVVSLELGTNMNNSIIREGADVYFECNIKSNPWVYKVSWRHNGKLLYNNIEQGTVISNQSLVLQSVTRARAGIYTCIGSNQEGDGESNPVQLDIKFAPVCRPGQLKIYGVARHEVTRIICELEANPPEVQFTWTFNNSVDTIDIPQSHVAVDRTRSQAVYTPMTELDYGTLVCQGKNEIGLQKEPCVYTINPAGKPDPPFNCTFLNQTFDTLQIECEEGFDGGLSQQFTLEMFDAASRKIVTNITQKIPFFVIRDLKPGVDFDLLLFASNKKGKSQVTTLRVSTPKSAERQIAVIPMLLRIKPMLGIITTAVTFLIVFIVIIALLTKTRRDHCHHNRDDDIKEYRDDASTNSLSERNNSLNNSAPCVTIRNGQRDRYSDRSSMEPLNKTGLSDSADSLDEKNPDIIPSYQEKPTSNNMKNKDDDDDDDEKAFERLNNVEATRKLIPATFDEMKLSDARFKKDVTYAELSLNDKSNEATTQPMSILRKPLNHEYYDNNPMTILVPAQHQYATAIPSTSCNMPHRTLTSQPMSSSMMCTPEGTAAYSIATNRQVPLAGNLVSSGNTLQHGMFVQYHPLHQGHNIGYSNTLRPTRTTNKVLQRQPLSPPALALSTGQRSNLYHPIVTSVTPPGYMTTSRHNPLRPLPTSFCSAGTNAFDDNALKVTAETPLISSLEENLSDGRGNTVGKPIKSIAATRF